MAAPLRVFRSLDEVPPDFGPSVLTIGNFDGVHAGHRAILHRIREIAAERGLKASVLTFDPHPTKVVAPARAPHLMTTPEQRSVLIGEEGIQQVLILPFNREVAQLSPEQFVQHVLVERLGVRAILVGHDFCFGYKQSGNVLILEELGSKYGFTVEEVKAVRLRGHLVSSTAVRRLVESGKVSQAARLLQRPYNLDGEVVAGRGVGAKQHVPTLNLSTQTEILPMTGVYFTFTRDRDGQRVWPSITNVGYRPTFGENHAISVETFLLEPLGGETPRRIRVEFLRRLRDERQFPDAESLKQQILHDAKRAQAYFRRLKKWTNWSVFPIDPCHNIL